MKKLLLIALLAVGSLATLRAQEAADTVISISRPGTVVITSTPGLNTVTVTGIPGHPDYHYEYSVKVDNEASAAPESDSFSLPFMSKGNTWRRFAITGFNDIYFGAVIPMDEPDGVKTFLEGGVMSVIGAEVQPWRRGPNLRIGFGFSIKTMVVSDGYRLDMPDADRLAIVTADEDVTPGRSRIHNFALTFPITLRQNIYKDFGVTVGCVLNLNTYTTASASWDVDNRHYKESYKGLNQRFFSVDLVGALGLADNTCVMVKYSPNSWFRKGYGPEFKTITVGLGIGF